MKKYKHLSNSETASFCGQLALLLPAGITPLESICLMSEDAASAEGRELLIQIEASLRDGLSFYEALVSTEAFPEYVISMVLLGEEAGRLDSIMTSLAEYYEQQNTISETVKDAVSYPLIMVCLMLLILVVLLTKILPIFNQVFLQLGSGLTSTSGQLMRIGTWLQSVSGIWAGIFAAAVVIFFFLYKNQKGHTWIKRRLQTSGFSKNYYLCISYSRFAGVMSMIITSGIDIFKGLELSQGIIDNELMDEKLAVFKAALLRGDYVPEALKEAEIFQAQHQRMIQISYKTGDSDKIFKKLSIYYKDSALSRLQRLLSTIEPTLVIVFSLTVGIILLSVIMPLIGIMSSIG